MILIFAGAGASKAVNPKGYPTTEEFYRKLPTEVRQSHLFAVVEQFLRSKLSTDTIDIEQWLWAASEAREVFAALNRTDHPAGWMFAENRAAGALGMSVDLRATVSMGVSATRELERLEELINRQIYDLYRDKPTKEALERTWLPLLKGLSAMDPHLEVFTTNYDVVLEEAVRVAGIKLDTGRRFEVYTEIDETVWQKSAEAVDAKHGLLTKLHGSVDWSRVGTAVHFGTPRYQGSHKEQAIIYPGFKGVPEDRPFDLFHRHFVSCVEQARALIFVGFAFRDQYINQVLRDHTTSNATIVIVNPAKEIPTLPYPGERVFHFTEGLSMESGAKTLKHVRDEVAA